MSHSNTGMSSGRALEGSSRSVLGDSWIKVVLTEDAEELYKETRQWALQQKTEHQKVGLWHGKLRDRRQEIVFIGDKNAISEEKIIKLLYDCLLTDEELCVPETLRVESFEGPLDWLNDVFEEEPEQEEKQRRIETL